MCGGGISIKYSESSLGRIFMIRLENGDRMPSCIEDFAKQKQVKRAACFFVGGVKSKSTLVVGPESEDNLPPEPVEFTLEGVHEIVGIGTIFPDSEGNPILHAHAAAGRMGRTTTGCIRPGIETWHVMEVIVMELMGAAGIRVFDEATGFTLLDPTAKAS
jgi:uncharacterized protein